MQYIRMAGFIIIVMASGFVGGCNKYVEIPSYPTIDTLTAGIFLEPEERTALPPGVTLRGVYDKGLQLTKESEGFRSHLYNDAARYCTIAYGHLVKLAPCDGSEPAEFLQGVSEPKGAQMLRKDMELAERAVLTAVKVPLTDGQYAALCDFVYNVGGGNFRRSTLLTVINKDEFERVPLQLRRWVKAGGRELAGLKTRREREIELFFEDSAIPRAVPAPDEILTPIDIQQGES